jgi:heptosyltransferase-2
VLRILCVRFSSIGDVLLTTPLVRALHRRHPEAELYFVTKRAMAPLIIENPHLTGVLALGPDERIGDFAARLRALGPTHGLDLHGSLRSTALRWLVPARWAGYSKRKLARTTLIATKINLYGKHVPVPERYFEAARALGLDVEPDAGGGPPEFFLAPAARAHMTHWLREVGLDQKPFAALAPGAAHATKRWPIAHWRALADRLQQLGFGMVVVGGPQDRELGDALGGGPGVVNTAGEFSLQETGACLARATVAISGDTGVMHMATGVGTRVVALFGPTVEPFGFFPYTRRGAGAAVVVERDLSCRPCSAMGSARCPLGHHRCLDDVLPDHVAAAVQQLVA